MLTLSAVSRTRGDTGLQSSELYVVHHLVTGRRILYIKLDVDFIDVRDSHVSLENKPRKEFWKTVTPGDGSIGC